MDKTADMRVRIHQKLAQDILIFKIGKECAFSPFCVCEVMRSLLYYCDMLFDLFSYSIPVAIAIVIITFPILFLD
jgi:hypothetical protein